MSVTATGGEVPGDALLQGVGGPQAGPLQIRDKRQGLGDVQSRAWMPLLPVPSLPLLFLGPKVQQTMASGRSSRGGNLHAGAGGGPGVSAKEQASGLLFPRQSSESLVLDPSLPRALCTPFGPEESASHIVSALCDPAMRQQEDCMDPNSEACVGCLSLQLSFYDVHRGSNVELVGRLMAHESLGSPNCLCEPPDRRVVCVDRETCLGHSQI